MSRPVSRRIGLFVLSSIASILAGCAFLDGAGQASRVAWPGTELILVDTADAGAYSRVVASSRSPASAVARAGKPVPGDLRIMLRAEVAPPETADGTVLQASHIALAPDGKTAFATYMLQGEARYGALDVFDVSDPAVPRLVSQDQFPDADLAAVVFGGNTVYLAGSKEDAAGNAWVVAIPFQGNRIVIGAYRETHLPGHFATDLAVRGDSLLVATGTTAGGAAAGLYVLDAKDLSIVSARDTAGLDDLRSVAGNGELVAAFAGQWPADAPTSEAKLRFYDGTGLLNPLDLSLPAFSVQAEAKSRMEFIGPYLYVASNRSGVAVVDPVTRALAATVPPPSLDPAIVPLENQSSNAVSSGFANSKTVYFIANGEAGLWVGDGDGILDAGGVPGHGIAGTVRFGAGQSVNYVAAKNGLVVAAVGIGGLKILELTQ